MTYRELLNKLSDEEFGQAIIDDVVLHMSCNCSIVDGKPVCPYEIGDCLKCVVRLLSSDVDDIEAINSL